MAQPADGAPDGLALRPVRAVHGNGARAMSGIEAAFFGSLVRDAELKRSRNGREYVRAFVRIGESDAAQWVALSAFDEQSIVTVERMTKGAHVYVEGTLTLNEWTAADGAQKHGLSVMSWHCRLAQIGRNKPKRERTERPAPSASAAGFYGDEISF